MGMTPTKIYARNTKLKEIGAKTAKEFHQENHFDGFVPSSINIGLHHDDDLVFVMSFAKSRFNRSFDYEITRVASKKYHSVLGAMSKVMKYFANKYSSSVITYANKRYGGGNGYSSFMEYIKDTIPGYKYYNKDTGLLESRMKYQKADLPHLLENYDPSLTEKQNMQRNGFYILQDCGNKVFCYREETTER